MRAILIDPEQREIKEVILDENKSVLKQWYTLLDCSLVEVAVNINWRDSILVDEEGAYRAGRGPCFFFSYADSYQPFFWGKGLVVGTTKEGKSTDCHSSLEEITSKVRFVPEEEVMAYYSEYELRKQKESERSRSGGSPEASATA